MISQRTPAIEQTMSVLGKGICIENQAYADSLGFSDCGIDASILPPMIRRRTSTATKMAVTALEKACLDAEVKTDLPVIFVSTAGEMDVTNKLCQAIASLELPLSPTLFHNSVHNSAAGYWSMAVNSMAPMQSMAGLEDSFALGLLESFCQLNNGMQQLILVSYDESMPEYLLKNYSWQACATALVLGQPVADKPSLSRPYLSNDVQHTNSRFPTDNPVCEAFSLLEILDNNLQGIQNAQISNGKEPWLINCCSRVK